MVIILTGPLLKTALASRLGADRVEPGRPHLRAPYVREAAVERIFDGAGRDEAAPGGVGADVGDEFVEAHGGGW